jgi:hypothetical protein
LRVLLCHRASKTLPAWSCCHGHHRHGPPTGCHVQTHCGRHHCGHGGCCFCCLHDYPWWPCSQMGCWRRHSTPCTAQS